MRVAVLSTKNDKRTLDRCYQNRLGDEEIYSHFMAVTTKARKLAKVETKALLGLFLCDSRSFTLLNLADELEAKITETHNKLLEEECGDSKVHFSPSSVAG